MDVATPLGRKGMQKEPEKKLKYEDLRTDIQRM
jgi:hypothetical protein